MKTANVMIGLSLLTLVSTTSYADSLDVPDDLKTVVNQYEFVAHIAMRCDIDLTVYGFKGAYKEDCTSFLAQVPLVSDAWEQGTARWSKLEQAVDRSTNRAARTDWRTIGSRLTRHLDQISKTLDHIKFLRNAHTTTKKGTRP